MTVYCSTSHIRPDGYVGTAEQIRDILCGPPDHNEHCKGWRWHLYTKRDFDRMDNVWAELAKMRAERRAQMEQS